MSMREEFEAHMATLPFGEASADSPAWSAWQAAYTAGKKAALPISFAGVSCSHRYGKEDALVTIHFLDKREAFVWAKDLRESKEKP